MLWIMVGSASISRAGNTRPCGVQALLRSEQRFTESSVDHPNRKMAIVTDHNSRFDVLCILAYFIESAILYEPKMRLPQMLSGGKLPVPRPVDSHSCEASINAPYSGLPVRQIGSYP